ncbi:MAG: ArsR family transcriptional regulator [Candidatus Lokiarchaeota archaeon]|nr:ArsR family transcriptional regulator [Candidatus Lokiarchaeota archaeon]
MTIEEDWDTAKKLLELLGNKTRVEILRLLSKKECYVSEISRELDIGQQAILRHLRKLSKFKFLYSFEENVDEEDRGRGRRRKYYTIREDYPFKMLINFTEEKFNIKLEQEEISEADEETNLLEILKSWPGLKYYEDQYKRISNIPDQFDRLRFVNDLIKELKVEYERHKQTVNYLASMLRKLRRIKEKIKDEI